MTSDYPITKVLLHYFPHWEPPGNTKSWNPCLCPSHAETRPSCAVNYDEGGVKCQACGFKGNVISIIKYKEGVSYDGAVLHAESILGGKYDTVRRKPARVTGRRVFGESGTDAPRRSEVPPWLR